MFDRKYYLLTYPDVRHADVSPLFHYIKYGWREGRNPSSMFNTRYYLQTNPDVFLSNINPLVHYIRFGKLEGRPPSFNGASNSLNIIKVSIAKGDLANAEEVDLVKHLTQPSEKLGNVSRGIKYLKNFGLKKFLRRTVVKLTKQIRVQEQPIFTFEKEIGINLFEEIYNTSLATANNKGNSDYIDYSDHDELSFASTVKLIAFYLPQFHPFPENDKWWGRGFTEWTNVSKATPQFVGHYQPRLPGELGFYDLRIQEIQRRQVELAKKYGIHGFCFHYYWFNGKRLMDMPLHHFIDDPEIDFPFCICWANENWTRRWDGQNNEILIGQAHSFENDRRFIEDLEPVLRSPRYIRIDGRPLIIVYRAILLENPKKTVQYWKRFCVDRGLGEPLLIAAQTFGFKNPLTVGFDVAIEFPPHNIVIEEITGSISLVNKDYAGAIYDYKKMIEHNIPLIDEDYRVIRTVVPGWDNEARMPGRGHTFAFSTPGLYQRWLEKTIFEEECKQPEENRLVFINAWNEWAEGAYLEPDRKFGYAYLQATKEALKNVRNRYFIAADGKRYLNPNKRNITAVILHVHYLEMLQEIGVYLKNLEDDFDLFISLTESNKDHIADVYKVFPKSNILIVENRGRDIAPFIEIYRNISLFGYQNILKIHTKKSSHRHDGDKWRHEIFNNLLSKSAVASARKALTIDNKLGIIGPKGHVLANRSYWGFNKELTIKLAREVGIRTSIDPEFSFVAGSMFWAKPEALGKLNILPIGTSNFESEPILKDGALPHAIERLIGLLAIASGFNISEIDHEGKIQKVCNQNGFGFAQIHPD